MTLKRAKYAALCFFLLIFAAALIIYPERYVESCLNGFIMWAECVLPSLFPFMIIALTLIKTGVAEKASLPLKRVTGFFRLPPAAAVCFIISICSGYPAGSRTLLEFYERGALNESDVKKLSYLCSTSGPLFIIGTVGYKMFGDKTVGIKIFIAHMLVALAVGLALSLSSKDKPATGYARAPVDKNLLWNTFYSAVISVAVAGGFIAFFFVFSQFMRDFNLLYPLEIIFNPLFGERTEAFVTGLLEATTGCGMLSSINDRLSVALAGFLITFGGVSIILQQLSYLVQANVSPLKFIAVKLLQATLAMLLLLLIA